MDQTPRARRIILCIAGTLAVSAGLMDALARLADRPDPGQAHTSVVGTLDTVDAGNRLIVVSTDADVRRIRLGRNVRIRRGPASLTEQELARYAGARVKVRIVAGRRGLVASDVTVAGGSTPARSIGDTHAGVPGGRE